MDWTNRIDRFDWNSESHTYLKILDIQQAQLSQIRQFASFNDFATIFGTCVFFKIYIYIYVSRSPQGILFHHNLPSGGTMPAWHLVLALPLVRKPCWRVKSGVKTSWGGDIYPIWYRVCLHPFGGGYLPWTVVNRTEVASTTWARQSWFHKSQVLIAGFQPVGWDNPKICHFVLRSHVVSQSRGEEIPFSLVRHPTIPPGCFWKPLLGNSLDLPARMQVCGDSALKGFIIPGCSLEFW